MKRIIKFLTTVILLLHLPANALTFNVLTLPADLLNCSENYFGFLEPSEIFANDIISYFNASNGRLSSPDLYTVRAELARNPQLQKSLAAALKNFNDAKFIDFKTYKFASETFNTKSVLIIRSYVTTSENDTKRSIWKVLDMMSYFNTAYDFYLNTNIILLDTVNDIPMWQNTYSRKLSDNEGYFVSKNYVLARTHYEKIKKYSKDIVALDASQNIILRFFPKVITPVETTPLKIETNGGTLRYNSNIPSVTRASGAQDNEETDYGEMLLEF